MRSEVGHVVEVGAVPRRVQRIEPARDLGQPVPVHDALPAGRERAQFGDGHPVAGDDDGLPDLAGDRLGLFGCLGDTAGERGHTVRGQQVTGLVLEEIHEQAP